MRYKQITSPAQKSIALVAHDNRKAAMIDWCGEHRDILERHKLFATGTTGARIEETLELPIDKLISGPLGGDQQLGAMISEGNIDLLIFWDPFEPLPHDPDVKALLRIAAVWNIPVACNRSSADMLLSSPLMGTAYSREVPDYEQYLAGRAN